MRSIIKSTLTVCAIAASSAHANAATDVAYTQHCTFNVECYEQDTCAPSNYELSVQYGFTPLDGKPDDGAGTGVITDQVKDRKAIVTHSNGAFIANMVDFTSNRTLPEEIFTIVSNAEGQARLVTLLTDTPMIITYLGNCEGAD